MKKNIKIIFSIIGLIMLGIILYLNYENHYSEKALKAKDTLESSKRIIESGGMVAAYLIVGPFFGGAHPRTTSRRHMARNGRMFI